MFLRNAKASIFGDDSKSGHIASKTINIRAIKNGKEKHINWDDWNLYDTTDVNVNKLGQNKAIYIDVSTYIANGRMTFNCIKYLDKLNCQVVSSIGDAAWVDTILKWKKYYQSKPGMIIRSTVGNNDELYSVKDSDYIVKNGKIINKKSLILHNNNDVFIDNYSENVCCIYILNIYLLYILINK